jgi:hypothetical protein
VLRWSCGSGNEQTEKAEASRGWTLESVRELAEFYDNQSEDEQAAEHTAALHAEGITVMVVPTELVPAIVKLIAKKRSG